MGFGQADLSADGSSKSTEGGSLEAKTERHHTTSSLFNLLYEYLREDSQVLDLGNAVQLDELRPGQLVEIQGEYLGNPLEDVLAFVGAIYPYVHPSANEPERASPTLPGSRSSRPAKRTAARPATQAPVSTEPETDTSGLKLMLQMLQDIAVSPVHDLLFQTAEDLKAVVTVASEYYSTTTHEYLRAGQFRIVGKVTKVLTGDSSINLTRRTVLGAAGPEMAKGIIGSLQDNGEIALQVADPIVLAPAVQVLPMAIFI